MQKESKEEKIIYVENWTGYNMLSSANLFYELLGYLIESWMFPICSYEFNVVDAQGEKS